MEFTVDENEEVSYLISLYEMLGIKLGICCMMGRKLKVGKRERLRSYLQIIRKFRVKFFNSHSISLIKSIIMKSL